MADTKLVTRVPSENGSTPLDSEQYSVENPVFTGFPLIWVTINP